MLKTFGVRLFLYLFPAFLIAYGDRQIYFQVFKDPNQQKNLESWCFIAGIIFTTLILPIIIENQKKHLTAQAKIIKKIFEKYREAINVELSNCFNIPDLELNIRIFLPQRGIKKILLRVFKKELYFQMHNIEGLYIYEVESLNFEVSPKPQGLVGRCYKENKIWHDFNLKNNHDNTNYNLKKNQIQRTEYCAFAIAAPIFKDDDSIDAIITFDSKFKVDDPADDTCWENVIKKACKTIHLCKPLLNYKNFYYE